MEIDGETIVCSGTHGEQNIGDAFANSCNVAFALIAQELGGDVLEEYTQKAGLMDSYSINGLPRPRGPSGFRTSVTENWAGPAWARDRTR